MTKQEIMNKFYTAFANADWKTMNDLYDRNVVFNDEIFTDLNYEYVTAMWESLISNKENNKMKVKYELKEENDDVYVVWTASYLFGPKRRQVINIVTSNMEIKNDKIIKHNDSFNFKKWASQALGMPGKLFGNALQKKVSKKALENLTNYIKNHIK
ncbi:nuclear transport factor 2 family protein [Spiroplasma sp. DGKH1]|uniref:nuclear transport factor 2 family protein n=1 Tax=Spiroplasma sp. DGKH1 TaxID=3050074 RepID=UPI0034C6D571